MLEEKLLDDGAAHDAADRGDNKGATKTLGDEVAEFNAGNGAASVPASIFNLTTTILGSGALVMPHVCKTVGIFLFFLLLMVVAIAANYAITLLVRCVELAKLTEPKYQLVGRAAYGNKGYQLALWTVIVQQLGACILYIQIIASVIDPADTFKATGSAVLTNKTFWQCAITICVIFPLAMLKDMSALRYTSFVSVTFIMAFVVFVFCNGADVVGSRGGHSTKAFDFDAEFFTVVPAISFAFVCHMNVFPIYKELKGRSPRTMARVSSISMTTAVAIYFVAGTFGYLTFIDCTSENLIEDFRITGTSVSTIFDVLRGGYGLALIFAYPVVLYEMRHCVDDLFFKGIPADKPTMRQFKLNVGIIGLSLLIAILLKSIATVFAFVGATSGSLMVFVMPSLFYLKIQPSSWTSRENLPALGMLVGGLLLIPICVTVAVLKVVGIKALIPETPGTCGCSDCGCPGCPGSCTATRGLNWTACIN